jgi:hypothetical protein
MSAIRRPAAAVRLTTLPGLDRPGPWLLLGLSVAAWLLAVSSTRPDRVGVYGLLPLLGPGYWCALGLLGLGAAWVARDAGTRPWAPAAYLAALAAELHATAPLLDPTPIYPWLYKHIGVSERLAGGAPVDPADIYQLFPSFFAATGGLARVAGVDLVTVAGWSPLLFELLDVTLLLALCRRFATAPAVPFVACFVYLAANWVGQDYFAPQAFAFTLHLGLLLAVLTWFGDDARTRPGRVAGLRLPVPGRGGLLRLALTGAVLLALVSAHQLTPVFVLLDLVVLRLLRVLRTWWVPALAGAVEIAYLVPRLPFLSRSYGVFSGLDPFANSHSSVSSQGSPAQHFTFWCNLIQLAALLLLAAVVCLRWRRRLRTVAVPLALGASPVGVLFAQSYGNEGGLRVYLFAVPWLAALAAEALAGARPPRPGGPGPRREPWSRGVLALALAPLLALGTQSLYGGYFYTRVTAGEVAAARHLYAALPPGSTIVLAADNFPVRVSADYAAYNTALRRPGGDVAAYPRLFEWEARTPPPGSTGPLRRDIDRSVEAVAGTPRFLVVARSMRTYSRFMGVGSPAALEGVQRAVASSPRWRLEYADRDVRVFRYLGAGGPR